MTTRGDLNRYQEAVDEVVALANADLDDVLRAVLNLPPAQARDELLAVLPTLTDRHGDLVAVAAAEWYEEVRDARGAYTATVGATADRSAVEGTVRYAARFLFDEDPAAAAAVLRGSVHRYVSYAGRDTVARNVRLDPAKPRFGRVPRGAETCAFCLLVASRGFVYHSRETAGEFDHFHDECDCQIVPQWQAGTVHFDGYDPDGMYADYLTARGIAGSDDVNDILAALRSMGVTTDAHVH